MKTNTWLPWVAAVCICFEAIHLVWLIINPHKHRQPAIPNTVASSAIPSASAAASVSVQEAVRRPKVWVLGDSLGEGLLTALRLTPNLPFDIDGDTRRGSTITEWAEKPAAYWPELARYHPTTVLVSLGMNDARKDSKELCVSLMLDLHSINQSIRRVAPDARISWLLPPHVPSPTVPNLKRVVSALQAMPTLDRYDVEVLDTQAEIARNGGIGPDGVHPTGYGYATWAANTTNMLLAH